jgi:hypothetical protein
MPFPELTVSPWHDSRMGLALMFLAGRLAMRAPIPSARAAGVAPLACLAVL